LGLEKVRCCTRLESHHLAVPPPDDNLEAIAEALSKLAALHPQVAELVQLRYFAALTLAQCADVLGVSERTADTWWAYGRAWLAVNLTEN
jgi:DNA-directed RNA polymerase specialized sigma24 family protein